MDRDREDALRAEVARGFDRVVEEISGLRRDVTQQGAEVKVLASRVDTHQLILFGLVGLIVGAVVLAIVGGALR